MSTQVSPMDKPASAAPARQPVELSVTLPLRNDSTEPWTPETVSVGWQAFDPETGRFILEGPWQALPSVLQPGQQAELTACVVLPPLPASYHIYVSSHQADRGWAYAQGKPFLLLEVAVAEDGTSQARQTWTTLPTLRRGRMLPRLWRSAQGLWQTPWRHRALLAALARRDIQARYRGSYGEIAWTVLHPLLLMATYFFVFGIVLQSRFGGTASRSAYVLYFLAGMLPWLPISEAIGRAPSSVYDNRQLVKKLIFPVGVLPLTPVAAGLLSETITIGLFLLLLLAVRHAVPLTALWLPALLVPQVLFTAGLCWFVAALGVFLRDLQQIIGFLLTLTFFLTPICYPETALPPQAAAILLKSPLYLLVHSYREVLLEGRAPNAISLLMLWMFAMVVYVCGYLWFRRVQRAMVEAL